MRLRRQCADTNKMNTQEHKKKGHRYRIVEIDVTWLSPAKAKSVCHETYCHARVSILDLPLTYPLEP